jgi:hypothetical protein
MVSRPNPLAPIADWKSAADETIALLHEHEELMQRRAQLFRRRAELFREIVYAARGFVEEAEAGVARRE